MYALPTEINREMYRFNFAHPTTVLLAGPTQCGKTQFLIKAVVDHRIQPPPQRIVWVYGEWQQAYAQLLLDVPSVEFVKDFTNELYESFDPRMRNLLVLDDQMENKAAHRRSGNAVTKFFTQGSHHRNLTVVYIVQNLFNKDSSMRTVSLNTHYMVLFKNPRDATQIRTLSCQMYPDNRRLLMDAYRDATDEPFGYLSVNLRPDACDQLRILTDVFEPMPTAYVPVGNLRSHLRV
jgi:hypothetical protein